MLKKLIFVDKESWVKISRQIRLISRGLEPQTRQYNSDSTQLEMSEVNSPERKRPRQEDMDSKVVLRFHKLSEKAHTPTRGSKLSAGYDLYSAEQCTIPAKGKKCVKTDIQIELPPGCYGRVAPRSGLAVRHFIDVGAGVIDEDYRGPVGVVMFNFDSEDFQVKPGDRIAQLICEKIFLPDLEESKEKLSETARGAGGFGSTGVSLTETNGTSKDDNKTNGHGATNGDKTNGHASVDTKEATNGETTPKPTEDESKEKN